jgi:hypothetical protein
VHAVTINAYKIVFVNPEGNRPLGRPKRRWNNIKTNLKYIGLKDLD